MIPNKDGEAVAPERLVIIILAILLALIFFLVIYKLRDRLLT